MDNTVLTFSIIIIAAILLVTIGGVLGAIVGAHTQRDTVEDHFKRRDAYRQKEKALRKELLASNKHRDELRREVLLLRDERDELNEEIGELRYRLRKADYAKERGNNE